MLPLLQVANEDASAAAASKEVDLTLSGDLRADEGSLLKALAAVATGELMPKANAGGFVDFQLSRGLLGVST